nr:DUF47 family protein [uncultured Holophaga sp.]
MSFNAILKWIKPREVVFFDLLEQSASNVLESARAFDRGLRSVPVGDWAAFRRSIKELEHQGDETTHTILDRLDKTFVTPLEKEDIRSLAHVLDDIVDCIDSIAERLVIYRITKIPVPFQDMSALAVEASGELLKLISGLRKLTDTSEPRSRIRLIKELENHADTVYHQALGEMFERNLEVIELIKWKELFDTMERTVDAIDLAAQVVGSTIMKNA